MEAKDLEFFREYLTQMIDDIQRQGEATIEDMSENVEYYSDPADRASAESDRTFTLRLRDRDRKLVKKINEALDRIDDGSFGFQQCSFYLQDIWISILLLKSLNKLRERQ